MATPDPSSEPQLQERLDDALRRTRLESARLLNLVRLVLILGILPIYMVALFALGTERLAGGFPILVVYFAAAVATWWAGRSSERFAHASRYFVPLVDMPTVLLTQWRNLDPADPQNAGATGMTLYLVLAVLATLSIEVRVIGVAVIVAWACQSAFAAMIGLPGVSLLGSVFMTGVSVWMVYEILRRRTANVQEAALREVHRERLARYFSPGIAEAIEENNPLAEGQSRELTVLCSDIRGFTEFSEDRDPAVVVEILRDYHEKMVARIFEFGGTLDKYLGDGILAYFNIPVAREDHADQALRCALAMRRDLQLLNERWIREGLPPMRIGIGIHTGVAIVGTIGASFRREFTAIGDAVNVASRIEGLTKDLDRDILVSEASIERLSDDTTRSLRALGAHRIRGRAQPVELFTLADDA